MPCFQAISQRGLGSIEREALFIQTDTHLWWAKELTLALVNTGDPIEVRGRAAPVKTDITSAVSPPNGDETAGDQPVPVVELSEPRVIPGAEVLGRGVYIKPRQPYQLKDFLLKQRESKSRLRYIGSVGQTYAIPEACEVNDSPPLPAGRSIGQTVIEQSWNRFSQEFKVDANLAVSSKAFSIEASSFHGSNMKSETDSYYALRRSFIPFWRVYLPVVDHRNVIARISQLDKTAQVDPRSDQLYLPEGPFDQSNRALYAKIFERFGTHYVHSAWLGGAASLLFVVTSSSDMTKEDIKAGVAATFSGVEKASVSTEQSESQEKFKSNSSCTVFGNGGDRTELAKLTTMQADQYDRWVNSVKDNPEIIEFGVSGIWTLLKDEIKAEALKQAYLQESKFTPLSSIVPTKDWLIFTKHDESFDYALTTKYGASRLYVLSCLFKPHMIKDAVKLRASLLDIFGIADEELLTVAAEDSIGHVARELRQVQPVDLSMYLAELFNQFVLKDIPILQEGLLSNRLKSIPINKFRGLTRDLLGSANTSIVILNRLLLEELFPDDLERRPFRLSLEDYFHVLKDNTFSHFRQPHAAFALYGFGRDLDTKIYLFRWRECLRIDEVTGKVDDGYPKDVSGEWRELDFDGIDAAVSVAPGKVYFFRGSEYMRFDLRDGRWELTTKDLVKNRWPGVAFDKIDTAVYWGGNKFYFFSEDEYIRYDFGSHSADPGYPKSLSSDYVEDWDIFG